MTYQHAGAVLKNQDTIIQVKMEEGRGAVNGKKVIDQSLQRPIYHLLTMRWCTGLQIEAGHAVRLKEDCVRARGKEKPKVYYPEGYLPFFCAVTQVLRQLYMNWLPNKGQIRHRSLASFCGLMSFQVWQLTISGTRPHTPSSACFSLCVQRSTCWD